jgi:hypothetical protein
LTNEEAASISALVAKFPSLFLAKRSLQLGEVARLPADPSETQYETTGMASSDDLVSLARDVQLVVEFPYGKQDDVAITKCAEAIRRLKRDPSRRNANGYVELKCVVLAVYQDQILAYHQGL